VAHAAIEDDKPLGPDMQQIAIPARPAAAVAPKVLAKCVSAFKKLGLLIGPRVPVIPRLNTTYFIK
jgi:hypothetical protein